MSVGLRGTLAEVPESHTPDGHDEALPKLTDGPTELPTVTHLQFLVLDILFRFSRGTSAQNLRGAMLQHGQEQRGPKFYQLMGRLNEAGMVESWQQEFDVAGSNVSRTFYKLSAVGRTAWRLTLEFYAVRLKAHQTVFDRGGHSG